MSTKSDTWQDPTPYLAANGNRFSDEQAKLITERLAYLPRSEEEAGGVSNLVTTVQELQRAPYGYIAVDRDHLVYTKPFHNSNTWRLGGFTESFPADVISLPARLYCITTDGQIVRPESENTTS